MFFLQTKIFQEVHKKIEIACTTQLDKLGEDAITTLNQNLVEKSISSLAEARAAAALVPHSSEAWQI